MYWCFVLFDVGIFEVLRFCHQKTPAFGCMIFILVSVLNCDSCSSPMEQTAAVREIVRHPLLCQVACRPRRIVKMFNTHAWKMPLLPTTAAGSDVRNTCLALTVNAFYLFRGVGDYKPDAFTDACFRELLRKAPSAQREDRDRAHRQVSRN